ncbi:60 kDa lysophospholipase-like [Dreissena polymorpha]|uniref:Uncharacterized protein n=1 Tax=Dreissena polymorpha TaxID=45954 RepID=A0A9D4MLI1_DREPO|nr:60 kDa lysophospholipase-like [Dreissena polymorpha]XP_052271097.1 60 kDa lysophospholipase-like [Dreissena polymorpha]XP_052271103.1 60 kDa lysophospholipase-like [Dreissena polymorpha]XP_052271110.1 60 kDa lysophospholipase-like [Dreissena polymorpha]XP_052271119.1 60 kDa lysophospholipase-like [Dreissena polymorpha]KAH3877467.1 hypothetical protein DPMN_001334 [Dreissena polymorpha]
MATTEVVKALLEVACDSNMKTKYTEMTALHMASRNGHTDTVKLLLDNGADTEQKDVINKNAAFYAANQEILEMLQAHAGAELNSKSDGNQNVLNMLDKEKPQEQRKQPGIFDKKVTFSKKHKKIMKMSVFDRLTRSKSQLHVLK